MPSYGQKIPFARSQNRFAERKILDAWQQLGKALPCSVLAVAGSIVTVNFEIQNLPLPTVTCPMAGSEYIRLPIQGGCKGIVLPADVYLGGVSGLGGGTASVGIIGNLSALVFLPIANANWSATDDPNSVVIYGPDGVILRTMDKTGSLAINANGATFTIPSGKTVVMSELPTSPPTKGLWNNGNVVNVVP